MRFLAWRGSGRKSIASVAVASSERGLVTHHVAAVKRGGVVAMNLVVPKIVQLLIIIWVRALQHLLSSSVGVGCGGEAPKPAPTLRIVGYSKWCFYERLMVYSSRTSPPLTSSFGATVAKAPHALRTASRVTENLAIVKVICQAKKILHKPSVAARTLHL